MEGKTHYERIIGGNQEERRAASEELQAAFKAKSEVLAKYETEKTPEDIEILNRIESIVDRMVAQYDGDPKPLPLDHIYILEPGGVSVATGERFLGGVHQPYGLNIGVERGNSRLLFAGTVAHELFHLKSYKSARVGKTGEDVRLYRSGLSMFDRKDQGEELGDEKEYFALLEEAIVVECTKRFLDEIGDYPVFSEEVAAFRKFRDWVIAYYRKVGIPEEDIQIFEMELKYIADPQDKIEKILSFSDDETRRIAYAAGMLRSLHEKGDVIMFERYAERKKFYELLDRLVANSDGKFKDRDEIFDEFAKANFSGNYLPLARTIEDILGKGSFRKLAEEFSKEPKNQRVSENNESLNKNEKG